MDFTVHSEVAQGLTGNIPADLFSYAPLNTSLQYSFQSTPGFINAFPSVTGLTSVTTLDWSSCANVTGWTASTVPASLTSAVMTGNAFTAAAVNQILVDFDTAGATGGTLNISGGTSAAPTTGPPDGVAAKASLTGKGWAVTTN